jgi:hypothetical protein
MDSGKTKKTEDIATTAIREKIIMERELKEDCFIVDALLRFIQNINLA